MHNFNSRAKIAQNARAMRANPSTHQSDPPCGGSLRAFGCTEPVICRFGFGEFLK
jgi:hypothetical protein